MLARDKGNFQALVENRTRGPPVQWLERAILYSEGREFNSRRGYEIFRCPGRALPNFIVSPPSKLKMFTGTVCVLLTSVSLKLIKIKIKFIYAKTSSWQKKKNGGWKVSDADWFYFSFYDPSCFFYDPSLSESNFISFLFFYSIRVGPSRSELIRPGLAVRVDPVRLLYLPEFYLCFHNSCEIWHLFSWASMTISLLWCYYK